MQRVRERVVDWMRIDWFTPTSARDGLSCSGAVGAFRVLDGRKPSAGHHRQARTPDKPHTIVRGQIRIGSRADWQQRHRSPRR